MMTRYRYAGRRDGRRGFTLIEVLISITILIIGLVGVLMAIPLGQRTAGRSAMTTRAAILASEKIEELKAKGYAELVSQDEWNGSDGDFAWRATIKPVAATDFEGAVSLPADKLVAIRLAVTYRNHGKERSDTFTTFYSEL